MRTILEKIKDSNIFVEDFSEYRIVNQWVIDKFFSENESHNILYFNDEYDYENEEANIIILVNPVFNYQKFIDLLDNYARVIILSDSVLFRNKLYNVNEEQNNALGQEGISFYIDPSVSIYSVVWEYFFGFHTSEVPEIVKFLEGHSYGR